MHWEKNIATFEIYFSCFFFFKLSNLFFLTFFIFWLSVRFLSIVKFLTNLYYVSFIVKLAPLVHDLKMGTYFGNLTGSYMWKSTTYKCQTVSFANTICEYSFETCIKFNSSDAYRLYSCIVHCLVTIGHQ